MVVGAVALGIASIVAFERMNDPWAAVPLFLLLAIPCAVLLALGLALAVDGGQLGAQADRRLAPWQTACLLVGIPLLLLTFAQFTIALGNDSPGTGTATWIFVLGGIGTLALRARCESPGLTLLAGLFFGIAAGTAIDWGDSSAPSATYRDIILVEGAVFLFAARQIWEAKRADAIVLVGLAGVALILGAIIGKAGSLSAPYGPFFFFAGSSEGGGDGWELVLILVTIGLLAFSAWQRHGGIAFIGVVGTLSFIGFTFDGNLAGWPVLLALVAAGCLYWSLVLKPRQSGGSVPPTSQAPPASEPPPPPPSAPPPPPSTSQPPPT